MGSKDRKVRDAKARELLALGFAAVPPQPETATIAATPPTTPLQPETAPAPEPQSMQPPAQETDSAAPATLASWKIFLLGGAAGFLFFCLLSFFLFRKSSRRR
jgi:D-alanyl-D-alanine carboxypeptidase (penicillin-binding protein 5/6)